MKNDYVSCHDRVKEKHDQYRKTIKITRIMDTISNVLIMFSLAFAIYVAIKY